MNLKTNLRMQLADAATVHRVEGLRLHRAVGYTIHGLRI